MNDECSERRTWGEDGWVEREREKESRSVPGRRERRAEQRERLSSWTTRDAERTRTRSACKARRGEVRISDEQVSLHRRKVSVLDIF